MWSQRERERQGWRREGKQSEIVVYGKAQRNLSIKRLRHELRVSYYTKTGEGGVAAAAAEEEEEGAANPEIAGRCRSCQRIFGGVKRK
ncbi:hypothetical protein RUM43_009072 [Polyplax serrata]|uniref:Uncharacterized protein n=1 Tax=Polyplax serrata TaxID=468196 RepID=A0AAN8NUR3_POLSC